MAKTYHLVDRFGEGWVIVGPDGNLAREAAMYTRLPLFATRREARAVACQALGHRVIRVALRANRADAMRIIFDQRNSARPTPAQQEGGK